MANFISKRANIHAAAVVFEGEVTILGSSRIGEKARIDFGVLLGYPSKEKWKELKTGTKLNWEEIDRISSGSTIAESCVIRPNTTIYENVVTEAGVSTGHNVLIRENTRVGRSSLVGSGTIIDGGVVIGDNVSVQSGVYLPPLTRVGNRVFIGPRVVVTNDKYPLSSRLLGVSIEDEAVIGANATLLAGITIERGGVVAAGAVVIRDVPSNTVVAGVPARTVSTREEYERKKGAYEQTGT